MKLNFYQTIKILFYCVLLSETIICSSVSVSVAAESEGRFLMSAGFLKKKKVAAPVVHKAAPKPKPVLKSAPKLEAINLMQKSEALKSANKNLIRAHTNTAAKQDMNALDKLALSMGNQQNPLDPKPLDLEIGTGPVWVSGWIKYFKYYPSMATSKLTPQTTPRQFMINPQYKEQYKINPKFDKKEKSKDELDNELDVYITENNKFYAKLVKDQLLVLSSRDVKYFFIIFIL